MFPTVKELSLLCLLSSLLFSTGIELECEDRSVCGECVTTDAKCMWCADEGVRRLPRCQGEIMECNETVNPRSEIVSQESTDTSVVPETLKIFLRPGETLPVPINVTTARNIPLDLYILFDVSQSLQEELVAVQNVSSQILDNLQAITSNVQVGAGAFVDKTILPYTGTEPNGICRCDSMPCACFNFRHYQSLTSNSTELQASLGRIEPGMNIDAPEAGFDAMAQVILCYDIIGWREEAVKIILYFSDDTFKFAGEGRYAGIMTPFEEKCQLESDPASNGTYLVYTGLHNDYTSPAQMLRLLKESNINPVFVAISSETQVTGFYNIIETFQSLVELFNIQLNGGASSAELDSLDVNAEVVAQNVLRTIDEQVLNILERPRLMPDADGLNGLSYTITAECPPGAEHVIESPIAQSCKEVSVGNTTEFFLNLTIESCETFGEDPRTLSVRAFPLGRVTIEITPHCDCDCDEDSEVNSSRCSFNGNYSCGVCICQDGYCGVECNIREEDQSECPRGADDTFCSGIRGSCVSCECFCYEDFSTVISDERLLRPGVNRSTYGRACECDFFSCLDSNNRSETTICNGRGTCCNGTCQCETDENGYLYRSERIANTDCNCDPLEVVCFESGSTELCSGRGECGCEKCDCPVPYTGQFCQNVSIDECYEIGTESEVAACITAEQERDRTERSTCQPCQFSRRNVVTVSCVVILDKALTSTEEDDIEREVEAFAANSPKLTGDNYEFLLGCVFNDRDLCAHNYYLLYNRDNLNELVYVAEEPERRVCTESDTQGFNLSIPLWALAVVLLAALLFLGIILLIIIKVIFMVLDYFEVKRLEREVGLADFSKNQNPLYQSPDVEYKNVAYGKE